MIRNKPVPEQPERISQACLACPIECKVVGMVNALAASTAIIRSQAGHLASAAQHETDAAFHRTLAEAADDPGVEARLRVFDSLGLRRASLLNAEVFKDNAEAALGAALNTKSRRIVLLSAHNRCNGCIGPNVRRLGKLTVSRCERPDSKLRGSYALSWRPPRILRKTIPPFDKSVITA